MIYFIWGSTNNILSTLSTSPFELLGSLICPFGPNLLLINCRLCLYCSLLITGYFLGFIILVGPVLRTGYQRNYTYQRLVLYFSFKSFGNRWLCTSRHIILAVTFLNFFSVVGYRYIRSLRYYASLHVGSVLFSSSNFWRTFIELEHCWRL